MLSSTAPERHATLPPDHSIRPAVHVDVACTACGAPGTIEARWVCVDPKPDDGWDGIAPGRIHTCAGCGAIDAYVVEPACLRRLRAHAERSHADGGIPQAGPIVVQGVSKTADGALARRPSHARDRLIQRTIDHPGSPEAWRRLGNFYENHGQLADAIAPWRKAAELGEGDFEAAFSLANHLLDGAPADAYRFLRIALRRFPGWWRDRDHDEDFPYPERLAQLILEADDRTDVLLDLHAAWAAGKDSRGQVLVRLSSVDISRLSSSENLAAFLARADLISLGIANATEDEDEITQLEAAIEDPGMYDGWGMSALEPLEPQQPLVRATPRVGRNDPCHCGSGKKFKKCHGR